VPVFILLIVLSLSECMTGCVILTCVCVRNLHIVSADHYFLTFAVNENRICFMASLFPYRNDNIIIFDIAFVFSIHAEFLLAFYRI